MAAWSRLWFCLSLPFLRQRNEALMGNTYGMTRQESIPVAPFFPNVFNVFFMFRSFLSCSLSVVYSCSKFKVLGMPYHDMSFVNKAAYFTVIIILSDNGARYSLKCNEQKKESARLEQTRRWWGRMHALWSSKPNIIFMTCCMTRLTTQKGWKGKKTCRSWEAELGE